MQFLSRMKLNFDMRFRKKRFEQIIADGLLNELVLGRSHIEALISHEEKEIEFWRDVWKTRVDSIHKYEKRFRSYGYESAEDYLNRELDEDFEDDLHYDFLVWMKLIIKPEDQVDHDQTISKHEKEIEACRKVLTDLEIITEEVARHPNASLDALTELFEKHDVDYLLRLERIIHIDQILERHYFREHG